MKKSISILFLAALSFSLMAFAYVNVNNSKAKNAHRSCIKTFAFNDNVLDPFENTEELRIDYKVDTRFANTISKNDLHSAKSIFDIIPQKCGRALTLFHNVMVAIIQENGEILELGDNELFNSAQLNLLQSTDYSTNFYIAADCKSKNRDIGFLEDDRIVYYMTVTPEVEAEFAGGNDVLIDYLRKNSRDKTKQIEQNKLRPGQAEFTVSKEGSIKNVVLSSSSGYPEFDERILELIRDMPENWNPARNSNGEKIDQELVFFFGKMGC